jgi:hypothetical protein
MNELKKHIYDENHHVALSADTTATSNDFTTQGFSSSSVASSSPLSPYFNQKNTKQKSVLSFKTDKGAGGPSQQFQFKNNSVSNIANEASAKQPKGVAHFPSPLTSYQRSMHQKQPNPPRPPQSTASFVVNQLSHNSSNFAASNADDDADGDADDDADDDVDDDDADDVDVDGGNDNYEDDGNDEEYENDDDDNDDDDYNNADDHEDDDEDDDGNDDDDGGEYITGTYNDESDDNNDENNNNDDDDDDVGGNITATFPRSNQATAEPKRAQAAPVAAPQMTMFTGDDDDEASGAIVGTCEDMCPQVERHDRDSSGLRHICEPSEDKMIKRYKRSAAATTLNIPRLVRTPLTLLKTCRYMEESIVPIFETFKNRDIKARFKVEVDSSMEMTESYAIQLYKFIWDRYKMIGSDFNMQSNALSKDITWVECHESMCRCLILMDHYMQKYENFVTMQMEQNRQQVNKFLKSLMGLYKHPDLANVKAPNRSEFISYYILSQLGNPMEVKLLLRQQPSYILKSNQLTFCATVAGAMANRDYGLFFKLFRQADIFQANLLHPFILEMRLEATQRMIMSSKRPNEPTVYPVSDFRSVLAFDNVDATIAFLTHCGIEIDTADDQNGDSDDAVNDYYAVFTDERIFDRMPLDKNGKPILPVTEYMANNIEKSKRVGQSFTDLCRRGPGSNQFNNHFNQSAQSAYSAQSAQSSESKTVKPSILKDTNHVIFTSTTTLTTTPTTSTISSAKKAVGSMDKQERGEGMRGAKRKEKEIEEEERQQRLEIERIETEKKLAIEQHKKETAEQERENMERKEALRRIEQEKVDAEIRSEMARKEAENRKEAERQDFERKEAEKREALRKEQEYKEAERRKLAQLEHEEQERKAREHLKQVEYRRLQRLEDEERERVRLLEDERERQLIPTVTMIHSKLNQFQTRTSFSRWLQAFQGRQHVYRSRKSAICFRIWQQGARKVRDRKIQNVEHIKTINMCNTITTTEASFTLSSSNLIRREADETHLRLFTLPLIDVKKAIFQLLDRRIQEVDSVGLSAPISVAELVGQEMFLKQSSAVRSALGYPDTDIVDIRAGPIWRQQLFWKLAIFTEASCSGLWNDDDYFIPNLIRTCLTNKFKGETDDVIGLWRERISINRCRTSFGENLTRDINVSIVDIDVNESNRGSTILNGTQAVLLVIPMTLDSKNAASFVAKTALQLCVDDDIPIILIVTKEEFVNSDINDQLSSTLVSRKSLHESFTDIGSNNNKELQNILNCLADVLNTSVFKLVHLITATWIMTMRIGSSSCQPYNLTHILKTANSEEIVKNIEEIMKSCDTCLSNVLATLGTFSAPFPLISRVNISEMVEESVRKAIWVLNESLDDELSDVYERVLISIDNIIYNLNETIGVIFTRNTTFPPVEFVSNADNQIDGALFDYGTSISDVYNKLPLDWASPHTIHRIIDVLNALRLEISNPSEMGIEMCSINNITYKKYIQRSVRLHMKQYCSDLFAYLITSKCLTSYEDSNIHKRLKRKEISSEKDERLPLESSSDIENYRVQQQQLTSETRALLSSTKKKSKFWHDVAETDYFNENMEPLLNLIEEEKRETIRFNTNLSSSVSNGNTPLINESVHEDEERNEYELFPRKQLGINPHDLNLFLNTLKNEREMFENQYI